MDAVQKPLNMDYGLTRGDLTCKHFVPLTKEEFAAARKAKDQLVEVLGVEEKLNLVLENYVEYEHELLQITLEHALFSFQSWSDYIGVIHQINRRLINLLSTTRLYLDHLQHATESMLPGDSKAAGIINTRRKAEYDSRLGYRVLEALRNHTQHRGLPLHSISLGGGWVDTDEGQRRKERAVLYLDVRILAEDEKFKKSVITELATTATKVFLKPLVRDYITGIVAIHKDARQELTQYVADWDLCLQKLIERYRIEAEDNVIGLSVVAREANGTYAEHVAVFEDLMSRRRWLERRNRGAGELEKLIISSE